MGAVNINVVVLFVVLLGLLVLSFRISFILARRSICQLITIFRLKQALRFENAKTLKDLGIKFHNPFNLMEIRLLRDYTPWAFQTLVQAGIVRTGLDDDMFYLSEQDLEALPRIQCKVPTSNAAPRG